MVELSDDDMQLCGKALRDLAEELIDLSDGTAPMQADQLIEIGLAIMFATPSSKLSIRIGKALIAAANEAISLARNDVF